MIFGILVNEDGGRGEKHAALGIGGESAKIAQKGIGKTDMGEG
jgi:hypothetical protein